MDLYISDGFRANGAGDFAVGGIVARAYFASVETSHTRSTVYIEWDGGGVDRLPSVAYASGYPIPEYGHPDPQYLVAFSITAIGRFGPEYLYPVPPD